MDDGKIVSNLNPTLDPPSSSTMDSLKGGCSHPLAVEPPLRADPPPLVFEVEGEMGPTPSILKGVCLYLDLIIPD